MNRITIFGAGLSGLIAARMLHERSPIINEKRNSLPNGHKAVLRFRSSIVGDVTNIPFTPVRVIKAIHGGINPVADAVRYSYKVTGRLSDRSVIDLSPVTRYVSPPDLVERLASTADINFGVEFEQWSHEMVRDYKPVISTIAVPLMMKMFNWDDIPDFCHRPGWTSHLLLPEEMNSTMNATVYNANSSGAWYRATINNSRVIIEGMGNKKPSGSSAKDPNLVGVAKALGLDKIAGIQHLGTWPSAYQKISELNETERESVKRFIMWLSNEKGIYSLGRFATWRPKLLLDDVVNDVRVITRLIEGKIGYEQNLKGT